MFQVIRVSSDFQVVLVQEIDEQAGHDPNLGKTYLRRVGHEPTAGWKPIEHLSALSYVGSGAAPLGDPIQVCLRSYHLALRRVEARAITVLAGI